MKLGYNVHFADETNYLLPALKAAPFEQINIDREPLSKLGKYDLVICSNVLEHLAKPRNFIDSIPEILTPTGVCYLSWTNWLSPWGGHEFSPWHFLGPKRGHLLYDKLLRKKRSHTPYVNLFPTYIGEVMKWVRQNPSLRLIKAAPRYYPEFSLLLRIPIIREFLTWNCAALLGKR